LIVTLRYPSIDDLEVLLAWENDIQKTSHTDFPVFYTEEQMITFLNGNHDPILNGQVRYMITFQNNLVGFIDLYQLDIIHSRAGVGVYVDPTYRRKGLAKLALKEIIKKSIKELSLSQLYAEIFCSNKSTIQLFENAGFKMNGVKKNWIRKQETYEDVLFYQLIKS
tara:strand:+ start:260 stop:757 length:498 start_codon:yes stop_codon:yes gene_type:complete